jgi:hypothetical protein
MVVVSSVCCLFVVVRIEDWVRLGLIAR